MGREFFITIWLQLLFFNGLYVSVKTTKALFNIALEEDKDIRDIISAMKKENPGN